MTDAFPLNEFPEKAKALHAKESITFFRSFGHFGPLGGCWHLEVRGSVFATVRGKFHKKALIHLFKRVVRPDKDLEINQRFLDRTHLFLQDSRKGRSIPIALGERGYVLPDSLPNGHFESTITVPGPDLDASVQLDTFGRRFIQFCAHLPEEDRRLFAGEIELIGPQGYSIISDVDDTIKLSNVGDRRELLANTFTREFQSIPGMCRLYQSWAARGVSFHYVSASPWPLYEPLVAWLDADGFPVGSMHLRHVRLRDLSGRRHRELAIRNKRDTIERILRTYPWRRFLLFGDSGEHDAEIYGQIARDFGEQVHHVAIRRIPDGNNGISTEHVRRALAHLPETQWTLFDDPEELSGVIPEEGSLGRLPGKR